MYLLGFSDVAQRVMTRLKMLTGVRTPNKSMGEDCCTWKDTNQVTHMILEVDAIKKRLFVKQVPQQRMKYSDINAKPQARGIHCMHQPTCTICYY